MEFVHSLFKWVEPGISLSPNMKNLKRKALYLRATVDDLETELAGCHPAKIPRKEAQHWCSNAQEMIKSISRLEEKVDRVGQWMFASRLQLGKKVKQKILEIVELQEKYNFPRGVLIDDVSPTFEPFMAGARFFRGSETVYLMDDELSNVNHRRWQPRTSANNQYLLPPPLNTCKVITTTVRPCPASPEAPFLLQPPFARTASKTKTLSRLNKSSPSKTHRPLSEIRRTLLLAPPPQPCQRQTLTQSPENCNRQEGPSNVQIFTTVDQIYTTSARIPQRTSTEMEHSQSQSTPSKPLCKRGGKQSQPQSANVRKANWDSDMVRLFLLLVIKELDSGFKGSFHTMTMHRYKAVAKAFEEHTHKVYDVKQLQDKYALLKKDWQSWSRLMDSWHGPTGISYNEATGLIQASDDWWAHYEKIDKNALKFKTKSLEHMDLMRRVYKDATAIGKFAWTPRAAFEPVATEDDPLLVDEEVCEDNSGLPPFQPSAQPEHTIHHSPAQEDTPVTVHATSSAIHADDTPTSGRSKRKFSCTTHPQRKKGQSEGESLLASSMENLASSVKLQQRDVCVHHEYGDSASNCIRKCMARLYSLQGLDPQDPIIPYGLTLMDNPANQAILLQIPTDAAVITWLRMKKSQNGSGPSTPTHGPGMIGWF